ncbi:hypothetical protein DPMN_111115 [Dreissena polymorpha]|uniref:Uncharacterized protein n=1 Tax=Dreissena polymorpha TaxID=45954 RepID=A0A9D4KDX3_DREPO|nr:hypothetical protein DPMN_111115 [Dreissena polymorpha]
MINSSLPIVREHIAAQFALTFSDEIVAQGLTHQESALCSLTVQTTMIPPVTRDRSMKLDMSFPPLKWGLIYVH